MKISSSKIHLWDILKIFAFLFTLGITLNGITARNANGDIIPPERRITWQGKAGIVGGIPNRTTIFVTIDAATYGNDSTNATTAINNAISSCPSGQVVYLPPGTYRTTGIINMKNNVTLRGAGTHLTNIHYYGSGSGGVIGFTGSGTDSGTGIPITGGITKGSSVITVSNAASIGVNDIIVIDQLNDGTIVYATGCNWCSRESGNRAFAQMAIVTGKSGNDLTIDPPLHLAYNASLSPEVMRMGPVSGFRQFAGVENLNVEDKASSSNPQIINMGFVYSCWVKNIRSPMAGTTQHLIAARALRNEIRDSYFANNRSYSSNSYGVLIGWTGTGNLVENNIFEHEENSLNASHAGSGNVFGYNYIANTYTSQGQWPLIIAHHGAYEKMNLWEGNYVVGGKYSSDTIWGSHGYNTAFRNNFRGYQPPPYQQNASSNFAVQIARGSLYSNLVGNVIGDPAVSWTYQFNGVSSCSGRGIYHLGYSGSGCGSSHDPLVFNTMLRHGNYDYATNSTKWCGETGEPSCQGGDGSHTIPNSLYHPSRPFWWCDETPWPSIGPDLSQMVSDVPAKRRYEGLICTSSGGGEPQPVINPPPPAPGRVPLPPSIIQVQ